MRDNTGDQARRTYNLNLANWIPDLFMHRVDEDGMWSLFDPKDVPTLTDLYGEAFEEAYVEAEAEQALQAPGQGPRSLRPHDALPRRNRQRLDGLQRRLQHQVQPDRRSPATSSTSPISAPRSPRSPRNDETAVCNLGSINLGRHVIDERRADSTSRSSRPPSASPCPCSTASSTSTTTPSRRRQDPTARWRPVGLGVMGLQDVFFQLRWPSTHPKRASSPPGSRKRSTTTPCPPPANLLRSNGPHASLRRDPRLRRANSSSTCGASRPKTQRAGRHCASASKTVGLRNSLLIAIAPTATIASIVGCYECIEPQISNLFKRETLSGEFMQINRYLVNELKALGLWTEEMRTRIKMAEGSIQKIDEIPDELKLIYRTVWEVPMRSLIDMAADRGAFIDQSQSLNLFAESPNIGRLSSMYMYAWKQGIKTTYYLRSRPATKIAKTTVAVRESSSRAAASNASRRAAAEADRLLSSKTRSPAKPASKRINNHVVILSK